MNDIPVVRLIRGLLRTIETDEKFAVYAANRLREIIDEQPDGWLHFLDPVLAAPSRERVAKLLGIIDGASPQEARTAITKTRAFLKAQNLSIEDILMTPTPPPPPPAPKRVVTFPAHCSRTREQFFVIAERDGDLLHWVGSELAEPKNNTDDNDGAERIVVSDFFRMETRGWRCPICATEKTDHLYAFWQCGTCKVFHCVGTFGGQLLGQCGDCWVDPATIPTKDRFGLHAEESEIEMAKPPDQHTLLPRKGSDAISGPAKSSGKPPDDKWWRKR